MCKQHGVSRLHLSIPVILGILALSGALPVRARTVSAGVQASHLVQAADTRQAVAAVDRCGGEVTSELPIIHAAGAALSPADLRCLMSDPAVVEIMPNVGVRLVGQGDSLEPTPMQGQAYDNFLQTSLGRAVWNMFHNVQIPATDSPDVTGADQVWAQGVNGSGVTVAVVDTGLGWHPGILYGLDGQIEGRILAWKDFVQNRLLPRDPNGHGTHVAGVIADSLTGTDGEWNGMAPGLSLVGVRVLDEHGQGTYEKVIQGIQWVLQNKDTYNIRVMNLSLVSDVKSPYWADPLNQAVMQAWANGIVVVVAAGNEGPDPMSVGVPGNTPYVITVGAFTDNYTPMDWNDDYVALFSSTGPTLDGFVKPDLVAPGAHITAPMLNNSYLARTHSASEIGKGYFSMAGTSQATASVSGATALILSSQPNLTPDQVKYRLMVTAMPWIDTSTQNALYSIWQQGAGRLNAYDAALAITSESANQGLDIWADLAGTSHYEGYSYYDEASGEFRLRGDYNAWGSGYGIWSGGYGIWSGGYGIWSGGYGIWSGGYGIWSGGYDIWSGGYGIWSGGYGIWSGGYGIWSGGYGIWSGSEPWAGTVYWQPSFVQSFLAGTAPDASSSSTSINRWIDEP